MGEVNGQGETSFNVFVNAHGDPNDFKFTIDRSWAILFSLENVFYDENLDTTPKQAFRVTGPNGEPLDPFAIPVFDPENYLLDLSFLKTGVGLKPFFRGVELTASSLRAWRLDYYQGGLDQPLYTTVMSGIALPIATDTYMLRIDLGLHWEIEGDAINRLGQGIHAHIALAVADFASFTLALAPDELSGQMWADTLTTSTTSTMSTVSSSLSTVTTETVTSATATTATVTSSTDTAVARDTVTETTVSTVTLAGRFGDDCDDILNDYDYYYSSKKSGKKTSKKSKSKKKKGKKKYSKSSAKAYQDCLQYRDTSSGKSKSGKKNKFGGQLMNNEDDVVVLRGGRRTGVTAVVAVLFVLGSTAFLMATRRPRRSEEYVPVMEAAGRIVEPQMTAPKMSLKAFGLQMNLEEEVARMRMPLIGTPPQSPSRRKDSVARSPSLSSSTTVSRCPSPDDVDLDLVEPSIASMPPQLSS